MKPRDPIAVAASFLALDQSCSIKRAGYLVAALFGELPERSRFRKLGPSGTQGGNLPKIPFFQV